MRIYYVLVVDYYKPEEIIYKSNYTIEFQEAFKEYKEYTPEKDAVKSLSFKDVDYDGNVFNFGKVYTKKIIKKKVKQPIPLS